MNYYILFLAVIANFAQSSAAQTPALGQLYPAKPPEGSSFVRVVNPSLEAVQVSIAGVVEAAPLSATGNITSNYRIVNPERPLQVTINGKPVLNASKIEPNNFITLILRKSGEEYGLTAIQDATQGHNALKADLRVYNLVPGCMATVTANKDVKVFVDLPEGGTLRRAINPIKVVFTARCASGMESAALSPPQLQAGSRYSLFITGTPNKPALSGNLDAVN